MREELLPLKGATPGLQPVLKVQHFGAPGRGPKVAIQAALHADEVPALLVARELSRELQALEAAGAVRGEIVLVPYANPLGLAQQVLGVHHGRFDLRDGINFNRQFADLTDATSAAVRGRLGDDAAANVALVRQALREAAAALPAKNPAEDLKRRLLGFAIDADIVLDLHCDAEASLHLYGLTPQVDLCVELGALLGARAILLATESGDGPFDEACSRPWFELQRRHPGHPLRLACFSTTVELRGQADTQPGLAAADAAALVAFLRRRGVLAGDPGPLRPPACEPTPLAASEPIETPVGGVVVFHREVGDTVAAGDLIAEVVDVDTGIAHPLRTQSAGVLYARSATRWALAGDRLAKVAGTTLKRTGKLLSA